MSDHIPHDHPEGETMSYYDYHKFVHLVPDGYTVPKGTQIRSVYSGAETFLLLQYDFLADALDEAKVYLDYDITKPQLPTKISSVIYNVRTGAIVYPVAVYQGSHLWSVFTKQGERKTIYTPDIKSFDTAPPKEESGGDDE